MKHARLISAPYSQAWDEKAMENVMNSDDGSVNWGAAFRADPGVKRCPGCREYYWDEADIMECLVCQTRFGHGAQQDPTTADKP